MDILPPGWEDLGAKGLVVLFVLMIYLGWLIPKRLQDRRDAERDRREVEKDATIRIQRETIEKLTTATQNFSVSAHTAATGLRQIAKEAEKKAGDEP